MIEYTTTIKINYQEVFEKFKNEIRKESKNFPVKIENIRSIRFEAGSLVYEFDVTPKQIKKTNKKESHGKNNKS